MQCWRAIRYGNSRTVQVEIPRPCWQVSYDGFSLSHDSLFCVLCHFSMYALSNGEVQYQGLVMVSLFCMYSSYGWPYGMLLLAVACCAIAEIELAFSLSPFVQKLQILLLPTFIFILEEGDLCSKGVLERWDQPSNKISFAISSLILSSRRILDWKNIVMIMVLPYLWFTLNEIPFFWILSRILIMGASFNEVLGVMKHRTWV